MKNIVVMFVVIATLAMSVFAADLSKEMLKQNKQIVKMAVKAMSKKLPQKVDKYTQFTANPVKV